MAGETRSKTVWVDYAAPKPAVKENPEGDAKKRGRKALADLQGNDGNQGTQPARG